MTRARLSCAARTRCLDQHLQLGRLAAGERDSIGGGAARDGPAIELVQSPRDAIDDVPCHHAVRRQLAADDRDEAVRTFEHAMLARNLRGAAAILSQQWPQTDPGRAHVVRSQMRVGKGGVGGAQQVRDVCGRDAQLVRRRIRVSIGGADVREVAPGQDEHDPAIELREQSDRVLVRHARARYCDVRAFREAQHGRRVRIVEPPQLIGPGARGIHHHVGAKRGALARQHISHEGAAHPSIRLEQGRRLDVAGGERSRFDCAAHRRDDESRIVGLRVVVQRRTDQVPVAQARLDAPHFLGPEPAMPVHVAKRREQIVQPHPCAQFPGRNSTSFVNREQKREWAHEVRRDPEQYATLVTRLEDEPEGALLEIADAAMDESRRVRRGARTEIGFVDQGSAEPAQRRVACNARPGDATTDDEEIQRRLSHGLQGRFAGLLQLPSAWGWW